MISTAFPYPKKRRRVLDAEMAYGGAIVDAYADWLKTSSVPKLFLKAEPDGVLAGGKVLEHARSLPAHTEVTVKGGHFVQEDSRRNRMNRRRLDEDIELTGIMQAAI
jgi:pimeloyl-ACP methyl ester carboxylesterase